MANITASAVLTAVDSLLPNQYSAAEKLDWLTRAEGYIRREILEDRETLPSLSADTVLSAEPPYDEMYRHYIEAQIHYANGEMARYNNAAALWNSTLTAYRDHRTRTAMPACRAAALRLC